MVKEKARRRTRAELRSLMLQAGRDVLYGIEPGLGFEELSYTSVFAHLQDHYDQKVTIGSVHERLWRNQREFQLEVLATVIASPVEPATTAVSETNMTALAELGEMTLATRRYVLQNLVRLSSEQLVAKTDSVATRIMHTVRFRLWAMGEDHPEAQDFVEPIRAIREATTLAYTKIIHDAMHRLNLRVRADAGDPVEAIGAIAVLGNAMTIGLRTDPLPEAQAPRQLPSGPNGELEEWHPDVIAIWALARHTLEFADDGLTDNERHL